MRAQRNVKSPSIEAYLVVWINDCEAMNCPIASGSVFKTMAQLAGDENDKEHGLKFSNGWMWRFLQRHQFRSRRVFGESPAVEDNVIQDGRQRCEELMALYEPHNVFHFDESAYFYCLDPHRAISRHNMSGQKKQKKRITLAATTNADGSQKIPLLFIGQFK
ncbi:hypothetical protein LEN26_017809 [Aphanomyces euteiches]|nr:hypothetical protein LEN26_017809 [Aphanomyces euteiches]